MSSYLNFYLIPKKSNKPLSLFSFSGGNEIYQRYRDVLDPVWCNGEEDKYTEITEVETKKVVDDIDSEINQTKTKLDRKIELANKLKSIPENVMEEIDCLNEYLNELKDGRFFISVVHNVMQELEYSDFEHKMLINRT